MKQEYENIEENNTPKSESFSGKKQSTGRFSIINGQASTIKPTLV